MKKYNNIIVPTDGSVNSKRALEHAGLCHLRRGHVHAGRRGIPAALATGYREETGPAAAGTGRREVNYAGLMCYSGALRIDAAAGPVSSRYPVARAAGIPRRPA